MNVVQKAKEIKQELSRLKQKGASATGNHANDVEWRRLVREKRGVMGDLKARGINWDDL